tara:strand:+ start:173 stop:292 length:120 start_codon:yes stop_codon:yes gene_type:complete
VKEIYLEGFPFENINNLALGRCLKIFKNDFAENTPLKGS